MNLRSLRARLESVARVAARLWTWEVSFPFDEEPLFAQLLDLYRRDFPEVSQRGIPVFLKMVAFNSDSGRKIRYLVVLANEPLAALKGVRDRVLPESISLYGIADEAIRREDCEGNAVFSFLKGGRLFILVFCGGRLCHWSEEQGYEGGFGGEAYVDRMVRFRKFLERDEYLSQGEGERLFCEYRYVLEPWAGPKPLKVYFRRALCDPFWRGVDLDASRRLKPLVQKGIFAAAVVACAVAIAFWNVRETLVVVPSLDGETDIELSAPPAMAKVVEPRASKPRKTESPKTHSSLEVPEIRLRSIVEGVLFQGVVNGVPQWFRLGDSVGLFVVKSIARDRIVLEGGGRFVEVVHE